ncbi:SRPBCC family protein [Dyella sp. KULCS107]|uniref:SRPBCC family protein n=1 Tax=Dyella sp. KULCS107 TaxID=3422216 RepID=UPI003D6E215B
MLSVSESVDLQAPADAVWKTLGDFGGAQRYLDVVKRCELVHHDGSTERVLHLKGGGSARERLVLSSDDDRALRYTMVESPLPVADYVSTVRVDPLGPQRCRVTWAATFDAHGGSDEEAREAVSGIYRVGLEGLRQLHAAG